MKGRVNFGAGGTLAIGLNWDKLVETPRKQGFYAEAFSAADAILDEVIQVMFQQVYGTAENFDLMKVLKKTIKAELMVQLLTDKSIVPATMKRTLHDFKWARNKVIHYSYAEYQLITNRKDLKYGEDLKFGSQEEFDSLAEQTADCYLNKARKMINELWGIVVQKWGGSVATFE